MVAQAKELNFTHWVLILAHPVLAFQILMGEARPWIRIIIYEQNVSLNLVFRLTIGSESPLHLTP